MAKENKPPPWKCRPCKRVVSGNDEACPLCWTHWTLCADANFVAPRRPSQSQRPVWNWSQWDNQATPQPKDRPKTPRRREGKEQREVQQPVQPAPPPPAPFPMPFDFANVMPAAGPSTAYSGAHAASVPWNAPYQEPKETKESDQELLAILRKSFPDQGVLPEELREAMNRSSTSVSKSITADMHRATNSLGKARKALQQAQESQRLHRQQWLKHLEESTAAWNAQLKAYQVQQAQYEAMTQQARADFASARESIKKLNEEAAEMSLVKAEIADEPTLGPEEKLDAQEQAMRARLQDALQQCAQAVTPPSDIPCVDLEEEEDEEMEERRKRARSEARKSSLPSFCVADACSVDDQPSAACYQYDLVGKNRYWPFTDGWNAAYEFNEFQAVANAQSLRWSVLCDMFEDDMNELSTHGNFCGDGAPQGDGFVSSSDPRILPMQCPTHTTQSATAGPSAPSASGVSTSRKVFDLHMEPLWIQDLVHFRKQLSVDATMMQTDSFQVRTWFVANTHRSKSRIPRVVQLSDDLTEWYEATTHAWLLEIDFSHLTTLTAVHPLAPHTTQELPMIDVIISQGIRRHEAPILAVTCSIGVLELEFQRVAAIAPNPPSKNQIEAILDVEMDCGFALCTCAHNGRNIEAVLQPNIVLTDGAMILCSIHPVSTLADASSFMQHTMISSSEAKRPKWRLHFPPIKPALITAKTNDATDVIALMQRGANARSRSPRANPDEDPTQDVAPEGTPAGSASSSMGHPSDFLTWTLYLRASDTIQALVDANMFGPTIQQCADAFGISSEDIFALHPVPYMLASAEEHVILVERTQDRHDDDNRALVMIDILRHHQQEDGEPPRIPNQYTVIFLMPPHATFGDVTNALALTTIVQQLPHDLAIENNGFPWYSDDETLVMFGHGDHLLLNFGPYISAGHQLLIRQWLQHMNLEVWNSPDWIDLPETSASSAAAPSSSSMPTAVGTLPDDRLPHMIIEQHPVRRQVAAVFTISRLEFDHVSLHQYATSLPELSSPATIRSVAEITDECVALYQCQIQFEGRTLTEGHPSRRPTGMSISILMTQVMQPSDLHSMLQVLVTQAKRPSRTKPAMTTAALSHTVCTHTPDGGTGSTDNTVEPETVTADTNRLSARQRAFTLNFHAFRDSLSQVWARLAAVEILEEGPVLYLQTYYVSPVRQPVCIDGRPTRITGGIDTWLEQMQATWADTIDRSTWVEFFIVVPQPTQTIATEGTSAHVLLVQHTLEPHRAILITTCTMQTITHRAVITFPAVTRHDIIRLADQLQPCILAQPPDVCDVTYRWQVVTDAVPLPVDSGFGLQLTIAPAPVSVSASADPSIPRNAIPTDSSWQANTPPTMGRREPVTLVLDEAIPRDGPPASSSSQVDDHSHLVLNATGLTSLASKLACQNFPLHYAPECPTETPSVVELYTDGSYLYNAALGDAVASWAFVVVHRNSQGHAVAVGYACGKVASIDHEHALAGIHPTYGRHKPDSCSGEIEAILRALQWMFQSGDFQIGVDHEIVSDALTIVNSAAASCQFQARPIVSEVVRPLYEAAVQLGYLRHRWQRAHVTAKTDAAHACSECDRAFETAKALAVHRLVAHGRNSNVRCWMHSTTQCLSCLKVFNATQKLRQHLQHPTNPCLVHLQEVLQPLSDSDIQAQETVTMKSQRAQYREPAKQAFGPLLPPKDVWMRAAPTRAFPVAVEAPVPVVRSTAEQLMDWFLNTLPCLKGPIKTIPGLTGLASDILLSELENLVDFIAAGEWDHCPPDRVQEALQWCLSVMAKHQPTAESMQRTRLKHTTLPERLPSDAGKFYVIYLYSGSRRYGDVHSWAEHFTERCNCEIEIIAVDIVFDSKLCNLMIKYLKILRQDTGPPPVRSELEPWGLCSSSLRSLIQVDTSNDLLQVCLLFLATATRLGVAWCMEHPAEPELPGAPSIWKLEETKILMSYQHVHRHHILQGLFGGISAKPTHFLAFSLESLGWLFRHWSECGQSGPFWQSLCGRAADGSFKTSKPKQYPPRLNGALIESFFQRSIVLRASLPPVQSGEVPFEALLEVMPGLREAVRTSGWSMGPDYVPQPA
eukprot:Skav214042  [mRNA]  locus=scaffold2017:203385:213674:+ [translate_table: standard]